MAENKSGRSVKPSRLSQPSRSATNKARRILRNRHGGKVPQGINKNALILEATKVDPKAVLAVALTAPKKDEKKK